MKYKHIFLAILILLCAIFLQSCTVAKLSGKGSSPILFNQPSNKMELIEHISVSKNSNFDYTSSYDVSDILADEIAEKKPDAVINTTVTIKIDVDNYLINLFTLNLANSRKIIVDADLMKEKKTGK
jgi:hypothetical protein